MTRRRITRTSLLGFAAGAVALAAPLPSAHAATDHPHVIAGFTYLTGDVLCKGSTPPCATQPVLADTVAAGDTLTFTNLDALPHSVTSDIEGLFDSETLSTGESATISTVGLAAGTYTYSCAIHGPTLMSGSFTVQ